MSIEELGETGVKGRSIEPQWLTTIGAVGAGIAIGVVLMLAIGPQAVVVPSPSPTATAVAVASRSPSSAIPRPSPTPANLLASALHPSVRQPLNVDHVSFSLSARATGWARFGGLYIGKNTSGSQGAEAIVFWARHPVGQYARLCGLPESGPIGATAADVADALATGVAGTELVSGPTDVSVGGLAAKRVVLFVRDEQGCGPGYFYTWEGEEARGGPLWGGSQLGDTITIWIVEIGGERFIVASETHLSADAELLAEVQQIIDSIEFGPQETGIGSDYTSGRHAISVDGTTFSFEISTRGWEPHPWVTPADILISKSTRGSQGAEEVIYWGRYPDGASVYPCGGLQSGPLPTTAEGVASRVAAAPGTDLVSGPDEVSVGGHAAAYVVVAVSEALGCDPGFFFSWEPQRGGAMWTETPVGTTIRVWVVEVDGGLLFIGAATTPDAGARDQEIQAIIDSIKFE